MLDDQFEDFGDGLDLRVWRRELATGCFLGMIPLTLIWLGVWKAIELVDYWIF